MAIDPRSKLKNRLTWLKNRKKELRRQPETIARDKNLTKILSRLHEVQGLMSKRR